jgi:hypothetical protein
MSNQENLPTNNDMAPDMDGIMQKAEMLTKLLGDVNKNTNAKKDTDVLVGSSPDDKIKIVSNGHLDVKAIKLSPAFEAQIIDRIAVGNNVESVKNIVKDQLSYTLDMCVAAINDLIRKYWDYQGKLSDDAATAVAKAIDVPKEVVRPMVMIATDTNNNI